MSEKSELHIEAFTKEELSSYFKHVYSSSGICDQSAIDTVKKVDFGMFKTFMKSEETEHVIADSLTPEAEGTVTQLCNEFTFIKEDTQQGESQEDGDVSMNAEVGADYLDATISGHSMDADLPGSPDLFTGEETQFDDDETQFDEGSQLMKFDPTLPTTTDRLPCVSIRSL